MFLDLISDQPKSFISTALKAEVVCFLYVKSHWWHLFIYFRHWLWGTRCLSGRLRFGLQWILQRSQCKFAAVYYSRWKMKTSYETIAVFHFYTSYKPVYNMYTILILIVYWFCSWHCKYQFALLCCTNRKSCNKCTIVTTAKRIKRKQKVFQRLNFFCSPHSCTSIWNYFNV